MNVYQDKYRRQSPRLRGFDYTKPNGYFITIRFYLRFSSQIKRFSEITEQTFAKLESRKPQLQFDQYVIMPDHVHFILMNREIEKLEFKHIGEYVRQFKSIVTRTMRNKLDPGFHWQNNYYERVIRNEKELMKFRKYILDNPLAQKLKEAKKAQ